MPIHQTNTHVVTALTEDMIQAKRLAQDLREFGVPEDNLAIVSSGRHYAEDQYADLDQAFVDEEKHYTEDGMEAGAMIGGAGGFILALGSVAAPGIGPLLVAGGLIAASIIGAVVGGTTGGMMGALMDLNIPEERAKFYEEGVRLGHVLVIAKATADDVREVVKLVAAHEPIKLEQRMDLWKRDRMREPAPLTTG